MCHCEDVSCRDRYICESDEGLHFVIEKKEEVIFKCYSSEKLKALNTLHEVVHTWYSFFTAESTEAMQIKCLAQGHNILMSGFKLSTSVTRNRHSNH